MWRLMAAKFLILFGLLAPGSQAAFTSKGGRDSKGTEFILGIMENKVWSNGPGNDIDLFITAVSNDATDVVLTTPLLDPEWRVQVTVTRGEIAQVKVPHAVTGKGVEKAGKGLWIRATDEVSVFAVNKETFSTDAFLAFPVDVLGTEYYVVTYTRDPELMVVAIENQTRVSITFPTAAGNTSTTYQNVTYRKGDTLHVTLDRFQTFHLLQEAAGADLTGAHIVSDKPVSAISGNKKVPVAPTTVTSADHLTEMLMPVDTWGKKFLTFTTPERGRGDIYRIVASKDNTTVRMSNGQTLSIPTAGHFRELDIPTGEYRTVISDKPVYVVIFSKTFINDGPTRGDPAMTYIIPEEQFAADYTWSTVKTPENMDFNNKLTVIIHSDNMDGLRLDGQKPQWRERSPIPGSGGMLVLWTHVTPGSHNVFHNDPAVTFMAIATGTEAFNSYSYPAGLRLALINAVCHPSTTVAGDIVDNDCDGMIDEETLNGIDDDGDGRIDEDLATPPRVDGKWGEWGSWGECSINCGGRGFVVRTRYCDSPPPANNGLGCEGLDTSTQYCFQKNCTDPGPVCARLGRRCLANATCNEAVSACTCPDGQHGDATIACVDTTHQLCSVDSDPKVLTWDGAKAPVNVPCWYRVAGEIVTDIISPPYLQYNKCSVQVLALNELTLEGLYYVRAVKVTLRFLTHDEAGRALYKPGTTIFAITQEQIREAEGNDPWEHRLEIVNSVTVNPLWDRLDQFAVLAIKQCRIQVKFRAHVPGQLPQILKPGVTVEVPVETEIDAFSSQSVCHLVGSGSDVYKEQAESLGLHNPAQAVLYNILQDDDIDQNEENPDYGAACSALSDVMIGCDVERQPLAVRMCTPVLDTKSTLQCLMAGDAGVIEVVRRCMNWVCSANIPDCNHYLAAISNSNCTTSRLMRHVGCDVTRLEAEV